MAHLTKLANGVWDRAYCGTSSLSPFHDELPPSEEPADVAGSPHIGFPGQTRANEPSIPLRNQSILPSVRTSINKISRSSQFQLLNHLNIPSKYLRCNSESSRPPVRLSEVDRSVPAVYSLAPSVSGLPGPPYSALSSAKAANLHSQSADPPASLSKNCHSNHNKGRPITTVASPLLIIPKSPASDVPTTTTIQPIIHLPPKQPPSQNPFPYLHALAPEARTTLTNSWSNTHSPWRAAYEKPAPKPKPNALPPPPPPPGIHSPHYKNNSTQYKYMTSLPLPSNPEVCRMQTWFWSQSKTWLPLARVEEWHQRILDWVEDVEKRCGCAEQRAQEEGWRVEFVEKLREDRVAVGIGRGVGVEKGVGIWRVGVDEGMGGTLDSVLGVGDGGWGGIGAGAGDEYGGGRVSVGAGCGIGVGGDGGGVREDMDEADFEPWGLVFEDVSCG